MADISYVQRILLTEASEWSKQDSKAKLRVVRFKKITRFEKIFGGTKFKNC